MYIMGFELIIASSFHGKSFVQPSPLAVAVLRLCLLATAIKSVGEQRENGEKTKFSKSFQTN